MEVEEKILKLIRSRKKGILQNDLWKKADIDRRKCSRIVEKLENEGKIIREAETSKGTRTYRIVAAGEKKPEKIRDFKPLLVGNMFAPCTGCALECTPENCGPLSDWIVCLIKEE